ncbi:deoxyribodipyrimidine photo-lyase [Nostoc sp. JL23]|nr:deoxyribodipyrimidine photo-lyase [Nostoc sp. JL23]
MHLLWFRRDLRLTDNEIVTLATDNGVSLFCHFPGILNKRIKKENPER